MTENAAFLSSALLALCILMAGCAGSQPPGEGAPAAAQALRGPTWTLATFGDAAANAPALQEGAAVTISFADEGRFAGSTGCNRYFGRYEATGDQLALSQTGLTRRACPPPIMEQERAVLDALAAVAGWTRTEDQLTLTSSAGEPLLRFTAEPAGEGAQAEGTVPDTLSGAVFYRPRIALPPTATVRVRLDDVSRADAPAQTLAEEVIQTKGRQVPFPFALAYDATQIEPRRRYAVRATIHGPGGQLLWTTDTVHPVLTRGAPMDDVRIEVVQTATDTSGKAGSALVGPVWQLVQIETAVGDTMPADSAYTIRFQPDGRFGGQADCNSYGGRYETESGGTLSLANAATTLAACGPDSQAGTFMDVLNATSSYAVSEGRLRLTAPSGAALVFRR